MDNIHACRSSRSVGWNWTELWYCEACDFTGNVWDAIIHAVKHQFTVK